MATNEGCKPIGTDYRLYDGKGPAGLRPSIVPGVSPTFDPVSRLAEAGVPAFTPTTGDVALIVAGHVVVVRGTVTVLDAFRGRAELDRVGASLAVAATSIDSIRGVGTEDDLARGTAAERLAARRSEREHAQDAASLRPAETRKKIVIGDTEPIPELPFLAGYEPTGELLLDPQEITRRTKVEGWTD